MAGCPWLSVATVSFITSFVLAKLELVNSCLNVAWELRICALGFHVRIDTEAFAGGHDRPADPGQLVGERDGHYPLGLPGP